MIPVRGAQPAFQACLLILTTFKPLVYTQEYQPSHNVGCVFSEQVCLEDEQCFDDGVLGRCISTAGEDVQDLYRTGPLSTSDLHLLAAEMKRVLSQGFNWEDDYSQCVFQTLVDHINLDSDYTPSECDHLLTSEDEETEEDDFDQPETTVQEDDFNSFDPYIQIEDTDPSFYYQPFYKDSATSDLEYPEIIPLIPDINFLQQQDSYQLPDVIPEYIPYPDLSYPAPTYVTLDATEAQFGPAEQMQVEEEDDLAEGYPEVYTVHYVPEGEDERVPGYELLTGGPLEAPLTDPLAAPLTDILPARERTKRRSSEWIIYTDPAYEYNDEENSDKGQQSLDFDYVDSSALDDADGDADTVYYSAEARFPLETVFDRRERLDVKKPGPFYSNSQNNFFIDKLLRGDYNGESDLGEEESPDGQTEYEFPLLTTDKQKKSDKTSSDGFPLSFEGLSPPPDTYLIINVRDRLSTLTQATSILEAIADQMHLPRATFGEPKLWPTRLSVAVYNNPEQLNATTIAEALSAHIDSVNARIPEGLDIQVDSFTAGSQSDVTSIFTGHSRLFLALFLLTAGISSALVVAGLLLVLRRRRSKNIDKEIEKEIKSEPVKEYKQLVRDWSRSSRASQSSNNGAAAGPTSSQPPATAAPTGATSASSTQQQSAPSSTAQAAGEGEREGGEDAGAASANKKQPLTTGPPANKTHQNSEGSRTSSTSSTWNEEPGVTTMDISTGHMVLNYMEDHLNNKQRLEQEWVGLCAYEAEPSATTVAFKVENRKKNRYPDKLPYDHNRVLLNALVNGDNSDYINASTVTDHDPRNPGYIVTQGPLGHTVADFWQMVWEQGSVVIVMLSRLSENGYQLVHRYWPQEGSQTYHIYEVHLVSEHVWCDDYLVRSLYLKNTQTGETRTVTQFHFLAWPDRVLPESTKSLLEFRRKVNKSYRGRSCPIIVHCSDGVGRSGTYVLLDMVLNRMNKGSKEIDIAATLEHIRDQRSGMVQTKSQFEFCLTAVAEETHAILKSLAQ